MGCTARASALDAAQAAVTPTQMRSLLFQGVHGLSTDLVAEQVAVMLGARGWSDLRTFASTGAGLDTMGARLIATGRLQECVWWTEGNATAQRAHRAFWQGLGQRPRHYPRADDWEMQQAMERADVELVTLRCAPFSPKHRRYPKGCWASLRELRIVVAGLRRRRPHVIIYENTAGLWQRRTRVWRRRVERLLQSLAGYEWLAMRTSPHRHSGCSLRRDRVFYAGVQRP